MPSRWEMRLSDAFASQKGDMEVVVHVWNINDADFFYLKAHEKSGIDSGKSDGCIGDS